MKKIVIIGSGALGSALANILADANKKNQIIVYGIDQNELKDLEQGKNRKYFGDIKLNKFKTSNNLEKSLENVDYIVIAVPSVAINQIIENINSKLKSNALLINGCKGFYPGTEESLHTGIFKKTKSNKYIRGVVSLSGPSFAIEMVKRALTSISAIGSNTDQIKEVQELFKTKYFKLHLQSDIVGAEIGGIYKNILAIGAGMLTGLGYNINTLASYLTLGMREMATLNKFLGGKNRTIYGLTGLGDLILTATDEKSRNFTFGLNYVRGDQDTKNITIEGLTALAVVEKIKNKNKLTLPIETAIYNTIHKNKSFEKELIKIWSIDQEEENNEK